MTSRKVKTPSDVVKTKQEYLDNIDLQVRINKQNEDAVKLYKTTGQMPPSVEMRDMRSVTDILLDTEKLKINLIKDLEQVANPQFALQIVNRLSQSPLNVNGDLLVYTAQRAPDIVKNLKALYKYGIKGDANDAEQFVAFMCRYYSDRNKNTSNAKSFMSRMGASNISSLAVRLTNQHEQISQITAHILASKNLIQTELGSFLGMYELNDEMKQMHDYINTIAHKITMIGKILPDDPEEISQYERLLINKEGSNTYEADEDRYHIYIDFINHNIPNFDLIQVQLDHFTNALKSFKSSMLMDKSRIIRGSIQIDQATLNAVRTQLTKINNVLLAILNQLNISDESLSEAFDILRSILGQLHSWTRNPRHFNRRTFTGGDYPFQPPGPDDMDSDDDWEHLPGGLSSTAAFGSHSNVAASGTMGAVPAPPPNPTNLGINQQAPPPPLARQPAPYWTGQPSQNIPPQPNPQFRPAQQARQPRGTHPGLSQSTQQPQTMPAGAIPINPFATTGNNPAYGQTYGQSPPGTVPRSSGTNPFATTGINPAYGQTHAQAANLAQSTRWVPYTPRQPRPQSVPASVTHQTPPTPQPQSTAGFRPTTTPVTIPQIDKSSFANDSDYYDAKIQSLNSIASTLSINAKDHAIIQQLLRNAHHHSATAVIKLASYNRIKDTIRKYVPLVGHGLKDLIHRHFHHYVSKYLGKMKDNVMSGRGRPGRPRGSGISQSPESRQENFRSRVDVNAGIQPSPAYVRFGKYLINSKKLGNNIVSLRRDKGSTIKNIPARMISPHLGTIIKKILGGGMPSYEELNKLTDEEKQYLHKVTQESDILDKLAIPTPSKDKEEKDIHQFNVLKGEIMAGNNSKDIISKFKYLVLKLSKQGALPKNQVSEILEELLELGL